jgi:hypothetical protein
VRELLKKHPRDLAPFSSVGYAQATSFIEGKIDKEKLIEDISTATNQLAKRQRTFWRNEPSKRSWQSFPIADNEENQSDVIRYADTIVSGRAKGIQRGSITYRWNPEQICNLIMQHRQQTGISVYSVESQLSGIPLT